MKITFVMADSFNFSGGTRVIATYAKFLRDRGHEVSVVGCPARGPDLMDQLRSLRRGKGWISTPKNRPSHFDNLDVPYSVLKRFRPIKDSDVPDADVVIATWWETAEWVANLSAAKGAKVYFVQHHEVFDYLPRKKVEASYLLPLHKIAVAQWLVDVMRTQYNDFNVSLVPNSVDLHQFTAPPRSKQSTPTIGVVYSTALWKGCDLSFKAFSLAAERCPNLRLLAFGGQSPIPSLPLPANTEYVSDPSQDQLKTLYASCDAWLFGSRSEGFGLPALEAMACRTPVIGTPAGAVPELLANGAGILVNPEDPEDMARAIERVYSMSEAEWQKMSDTAYHKATSYTWDDATTLFESALQTAIDRQRYSRSVNPSYNLKLIEQP